jgi:hypothetical protein
MVPTIAHDTSQQRVVVLERYQPLLQTPVHNQPSEVLPSTLYYNLMVHT